MSIWLWILLAVVVFLVVVAIYDLVQTRHAILRNFPVVGHLRYLLERVGPELRQYIVTNNDEERPFSRDQRRWVYATAKKENSYFGFGTDNDLDVDNYVIVRHSAFPLVAEDHAVAGGAKVMGAWRNRPHAFRPQSITNISAMSFGSLSGPAIEALNRGAAIANCLHNTGEGGISAHHRHGGDLIFQLGTGYFGARDADGAFSMDSMLRSMQGAPVKAIEVKLSQGAKPGLGGLLPGGKVTRQIAEARGVPIGQTVASPARHTAFGDVPSLVEFVESIAEATGVPVGIKSAVGQEEFWRELAAHMGATGRGPDFVSVDGGEGGTGAAPLVFSDHVSLPFRRGFPVVYSAFADEGLADHLVFVGSGRLGFASEAVAAMAMGVDLIGVGREAMLAIGCIQAQECHTGHCPTGVATQSRWLTRGLDPTDKSVRCANYIDALNHELAKVAAATSNVHPALIEAHHVEIRGTDGRFVPVIENAGLDAAWFGGDRRRQLAAALDD